jgi:pectinesterase
MAKWRRASAMNNRWLFVATRMPDEWYGTNESKTIAENILLYQRPGGGWPKNLEMHRPMSEGLKDSLRRNSPAYMQTFDNDATTSEMKFMAQMYNKTKDVRFRNSFQRGFECLLKAQYPNGGWPQYYPLRDGYWSRITYNDDCMVNIMEIMRDVNSRDPLYAQVTTTADARKAKTAFDKGLDCILKTQIKVNGQPTVWCAQHDEKTFLPALGRSYELPSFSGSESVGVVQLLMEIEKPSPEVIRAIDGAINWFRTHHVVGIRVESYINEQGQRDRRVVEDANAPWIWGRFYELDTEKIIFSDRDGIKKYSLAEIGHERRNGYSWYTSAPQTLLNAYPAWSAKYKK